MGVTPEPDLLNKVFHLVIVCVSDIHRRFKSDFAVAPFTLFDLLDVDTDEFVERWSSLEDRYAHCPTCLDSDLTGPLLKHFAGIRSKSAEAQETMRKQVQSLLKDIAEFAPITSDLVELKNGQTQWSVSRRGSTNVKNPRVAAETTLLQSTLKQHEWVLAEVASQTMPSRATASSIQKMVGVRAKEPRVTTQMRPSDLSLMELF